MQGGCKNEMKLVHLFENFWEKMWKTNRGETNISLKL